MNFDNTTDTISPDGDNANEPLRIGGTGGLLTASGTTAQRPTGANGVVRYNTDLNRLDAYVNGGWDQLTNLSEFQSLVGNVRNVTIIDLSAAGASYTMSQIEAQSNAIFFTGATTNCTVTYPTIYDALIPARIIFNTTYALAAITLYGQTSTNSTTILNNSTYEIMNFGGTFIDIGESLDEKSMSTVNDFTVDTSGAVAIDQNGAGNTFIMNASSASTVTVGPMSPPPVYESARALNAYWCFVSTGYPVTFTPGSGVTIHNNQVLPPYSTAILYRDNLTNDVWVSMTSGYATISSSITAAGTTQGTATLLTSEDNIVTTVASSTGVILPVADAGKHVSVVNNGANTLKLYPATGCSLNGAAANASMNMTSGSSLILVASSSTNWVTLASQGTIAPNSVTGLVYTMVFGTSSDLVEYIVSYPSITATDRVQCSLIQGGTMTAEDAAIQSVTVTTNIDPGVGFTIYAAAPNGASGTINALVEILPI